MLSEAAAKRRLLELRNDEDEKAKAFKTGLILCSRAIYRSGVKDKAQKEKVCKFADKMIRSILPRPLMHYLPILNLEKAIDAIEEAEQVFNPQMKEIAPENLNQKILADIKEYLKALVRYKAFQRVIKRQFGDVNWE